jgi:hypothetical protein
MIILQRELLYNRYKLGTNDFYVEFLKMKRRITYEDISYGRN